MMYMSPRKIIIAAAAAVLLFGARAYSAILATDANAMAGFKGTVDFSTVQGPFTMGAEVDYAVYAPGNFNLSFGAGSDPSNGARFVYAYQIHNTGTIALDRDPAFFSVGFDPLDHQTDIGVLTSSAGVSPSAFAFIPVANPPFHSATWDFNPIIGDGQSSKIVYYTSSMGPQMDDASVQGGGLAAQRQLPSPVPEPSAALAALGMGAALLMRRRNTK
jgi:MYXO-CTERM domain-containing protein